MSFSSLGLIEPLQRAVAELGYEAATPIQSAAIPLALQGRDVLAAAETGSGKTAAFGLPLLQRLAGREALPGRMLGLALVPTRELAVQVGKALQRYGRFQEPRARVAVIYGGVGYEPQIAAARGGVEIVVATPGRVLDLAERGDLAFDQLETLILDEADRLLALGFADELRLILERLPETRQSLLFSATFPAGVVGLAESLLRDPAKVQMEMESRPVARIRQRAIEVEKDSRTALLRELLKREGWERVLVFVGSKRRADNVSAKLEKRGIRSLALHGDLNQTQRMQALESFRKGRIQILMATDVAARGLDIVGLPCVVNYDLPRAPADYVHRIGRTGRAGAEGEAISFVTAEEDAHFRLIEKRNGLSVQRERLEGFEPKVWEPVSAKKGKAPTKGKRKSKKDKLREAAARGEPEPDSPWNNLARNRKRP
ncbi:DEAD/DEAH box helicase [Pelagicoccus sp. SDUM812003]|uniref:DEAD/DEAH box helicase n=1 Tax=Pelagicoccus sp. SDUM812003 TaxID=3041267 RepID=UPI00280F701C|nr:DEAD/DEAH box helicase [Pelagicoccus sp. SDUM812003]MDQ8203831.1 DEAD/DEAH box helicase [Pelagicoccus sp. SDUM812003]